MVVDSRRLAAALLGAVAVVTVLVGTTLPWYGLLTESGPASSDIRYDLREIVVTGTFGGASSSSARSYAEAGFTAQGALFENVALVAGASVVLLVAGLAAVGARAFLAAPHRDLRKVGAFLLAGGALVAFLAPIYVGLSLPGAFAEDAGPADSPDRISPQNDFAGTNGGLTWGPRTGWYVVGAALVPALAAAALAFWDKRESPARRSEVSA